MITWLCVHNALDINWHPIHGMFSSHGQCSWDIHYDTDKE